MAKLSKSYVSRIGTKAKTAEGAKKFSVSLTEREFCSLELQFVTGDKSSSQFYLRIDPADYEAVFRWVAMNRPETARLFAECAAVAAQGLERQLNEANLQIRK